MMDTSPSVVGHAGMVSGTNVPACATKQLPVISTAKVVTNRDALSAKMQQRNFVTQVNTSIFFRDHAFAMSANL